MNFKGRYFEVVKTAVRVCASNVDRSSCRRSSASHLSDMDNNVDHCLAREVVRKPLALLYALSVCIGRASIASCTWRCGKITANRYRGG